jgi:hypothetical protein
MRKVSPIRRSFRSQVSWERPSEKVHFAKYIFSAVLKRLQLAGKSADTQFDLELSNEINHKLALRV